MSRLLAVAVRELRERWLLFPGALASGCFPLVLPAFGVEREVMPVVGFVGAVLLGLGAAVVIGSSMLARDAANGRLGFLFSRPVPWGAIWGGKWLAAVVLVAGTVVLAMVPWMAVYAPDTVGGSHGHSWLRVLADSPMAFFAALLLLGIGFANFNATLLRSRSPWAAWDLLLVLGAIWATRRYVAPLWRYGLLGLDEGGWGIALSLAPLVLGLLGGSLAQVAVGRTDLRRAHRALSIGFWAVVGLALAGAAGYWHWARSVGPGDLGVAAVTRDPAGHWAYVEGYGPYSGWYTHGLLIDTASGRYARRPELDEGRPSRPRYGAGLLFSADGRFGALPHLDRDGRGAALSLYDLAGGTPRVAEVALESSPPPTWGTSFVLSPSAASVFVVHESGASLFALPSGRRVATATIAPGWRATAVRFPADAAARAWLVPAAGEGARPTRPRAEMRVLDLALDGQGRSVAFPIARELDARGPWRAVVPDADGRRIVTVDGGLHLRDGATGEPIATLSEGTGASSVLFLADGRIAVGGSPGPEAGPPRAVVRFFDRAGAPLGETRLDLSPGGLSLGPEVAPGRFVVSSFGAGLFAEDALVVDAGERRVADRLAGLRPVLGFWDVSSAGAAPSSVHFFRDVEGRVIRIDFATGERKVVAGPGARPSERIRVR